MRVLLLAWEHPPRLQGGLGRHVHGLARALADGGHEVHVIAAGHADLTGRARHDDVTVHRASPSPTSGWPVDGWPDEDWLAEVHGVNAAMVPLAIELAARKAFDLVHAHDWMVGDAAIELVAATGLPLVVTVHATERGRHQGWLPGTLNRWVDARERALAAAADEVIVCSRAMSAQVAACLGVQHARVVPNGVHLPPSVRPDRAPSPTAPHLLFVGRLEYEKGVHVLLEALARLVGAGRAARLTIAGDGTHRGELEALTRRLGLDDGAVAFAGFLDEPALTQVRAAADVAVVPSLYEPFGLVALESMAAGLPVIAADTDGLAEVVDSRRTGLLVEPGDPAALADAVSRILDDPALRSRLRARGLAAAEAATWGSVAEQTLDVYRGAVARRGTDSPQTPPGSGLRSPPPGREGTWRRR